MCRVRSRFLLHFDAARERPHAKRVCETRRERDVSSDSVARVDDAS